MRIAVHDDQPLADSRHLPLLTRRSRAWLQRSHPGTEFWPIFWRELMTTENMFRRLRTTFNARSSKLARLARRRQLFAETLEDRLQMASDFGDAPTPYPVTTADTGAAHEATGPTLGATRDD